MNKIREQVREIIERQSFQIGVIVVICFNAILFGLQTSTTAMDLMGGTLGFLDNACLVIFTIELLLKLMVYRGKFWHDSWNVFDFIIVAVSFVPDCGMFSSIRLFRVLRIFKLVSGVRQMRVILSAIVTSIPGIMWVGSLLMLLYYVYGILGTSFFGKAFPDWFGTLGRSMYSLFQIMTMESWSMGIARPVMAQFPYAWIYFVSYILLASFIVMNVVVGIVLTSIGDSAKAESHDESESKDEDDKLYSELQKLKQQIAVVEAEIEKKGRK